MESSFCYYSLPLGLGLFGAAMFFLLSHTAKKESYRWERELKQLTIQEKIN